PQTHEHLAVLRLLGVERGAVALTKSDLADEETIELARAEAEELVPGAAVVAVSAKTGAGLDELRAALAAVATGRAREEAPTRLSVDRSFTLRGIGTVVTGTLWSGSIGEGDELRVEPRGRTVRVRSVQVHDRPLDRAEAGKRVAVSLPGVERADVRRGDALVAPGAYSPIYRLDVALEPLADIPARVHVQHGTADVLARVIPAGDRYAQLRLAAPVVASRGDRVVLRAGTTVGGGVVLAATPPRHASVERMEAAERGETLVHAPERVDGNWVWSEKWLDELRAELERAIDAADPLDPGVPVPAAEWAKAVVPELGLEPVKVEDAALARFLENDGRLVRVGDGYAISQQAYEQARSVLADGITLAQFRDALGVGRKTAQMLLERFDADGVTRRVGDARVLRRR